MSKILSLSIVLLIANTCLAAYPTPTARWKLQDDAATATVVDDQGSHNLALTSGTTADISEAVSGHSEFTKALHFDPVYAQKASRTTGADPTAISGCAWIKLDALGGNDAILAEYTDGSGTRMFYFRVGLSDKLQLVVHTDQVGTTVTHTGDTVLSADTWYHVAFSVNFASPEVLFYINGETETWTGDAAQGNVNDTTGGETQVGSAYTFAPFDGAMFDAVLWDDTIVTQSQFQEVMAEGQDASGSKIPIYQYYYHQSH